MHRHTLHRTKLCLPALLLTLILGVFSSIAHAQRSINDADRVTLHGNTHPLARAEFDRGSANAAMPMNNMILLLSVRPDAQAQLNQLLAEQQDPKSPNYHKWLTPAEFGLRFGPTDQDIADASNWLKRFGFRIDQVANSKMWINFSGNVQQVERAFQTNIRQYEVNGKLHHANASDPTIPRALTGLVVGVVSLHDFVKHPNSTVNQLPPDFTAANGANFLAPADFATIYNLNPLYGAAPAIDGTGQTIAIAGRTNINLADVQFFRSFFGLPANDPLIILNGPDPGNLGGAEETEADLDVEWSGAVARNATIDFVVSQTTATTDGVDLSAQFIVNNNLANVMSTSFGLCEAALGAAGNSFWNSLWAQAAAQGITAFVSSGDSGAAGCDADTAATGTGTGVNGLSSTPNNISVGGTEFSEGAGTFWSATNDPTTQASALSYIPEIAWNESGAVTGGSGLFASGGGASTIYPKPAFQAGPGVPVDGARDVPDVSLSSASHDGYLIIQGHSPTATGLVAVGGTSAASPSFAGIMALAVQKTGAAQGNANTVLYSMAQNQLAGGTAVYHDITSGDNTVPGVTGFLAGAGYDQATGWGSVDAANLVNFWNNNAVPDFTVAAAPASQSVNQGFTANYTVTQTAIGGYSGAVSYSISGLPSGATATFTPASLTGSGTSALAIAAAATTPLGSYALTITGTDGVLTHTASITLVVTAPDFTLTAAPASQTVVAGDSTSYTATVASLNGYAGTVSFSVSGLPAGVSAVFTPASVTASGSSTLSLATTLGTTPTGTYLLTITATDGVLTHTADVTLVVTDFSVSVAPASQTLVQGNSTTYTVTLATSLGFADTVNFSLAGLPANATASFAPASLGASGTSTLTITTASTTPAAVYPLTITGTDGINTRSASVTLVVDPVGDFSVTVFPASQTIIQGQNTGFGITVTGSGGFHDVVVLNVSGLPAGATGVISPNSIAGSGTTSLAITTSSSTPAGTYTLTVTGTTGPVVHTATTTLVILSPDFSLAATPSSQTVSVGAPVSYTVTLTPINSYVGTVSFSVSGLPAGATGSFSPTSLLTSGTTTLTVSVTAAALAGSYPLTITGTDGVLTHTTSVTLVVLAPDFSLSASPASQTILVGTSASYSVSLTPLNGYTGTVSFSVAGLPAGAGATFTPASLVTSGTTTLSITTTAAATVPGTYPLIITGTDGVITHTTSVTLVVSAVPPPDFTISAPSAITVKRNSSGSETVTITGLNGFVDTVNLSISGLPPLVTATFTPASISGSGTSTLTLVVDHRAKQGIFPLTVTGTSGLLVHSTSVTLTVN